MELRPMVGHLSYKQFTQVRFLQLRLCFSGATEAQLFRNQQAVGSNSTGSFLQVSRNWQRIALPGRIYGFESRWGDPDSKLTRSSGGLKHRRSSFDSNTVHPCAGSGGQSGLQNRLGWFKSICALAVWCKRSSPRTLDPEISVQVRWPLCLIRLMERTEDF